MRLVTIRDANHIFHIHFYSGVIENWCIRFDSNDSILTGKVHPVIRENLETFRIFVRFVPKILMTIMKKKIENECTKKCQVTWKKIQIFVDQYESIVFMKFILQEVTYDEVL